MTRPTRSEAVFFASGVLIGAGVIVISVGSTVHKMLTQNEAFKTRELRKIERMLYDLGPYAPKEVLEQLLVDFKFENMLLHEELD